MRMALVGEAAESAEAVAEDLGLRHQAALTSVGDRNIGEAWHRLNHRKFRSLELFIDLYRNRECLLIFRTATRLAVVALAAQIGIIDLHKTAQLTRFLAMSHCLHHLVFETPRRSIAHVQMLHRFQCRHVGLCRRQQVQTQKPMSKDRWSPRARRRFQALSAACSPHTGSTLAHPAKTENAPRLGSEGSETRPASANETAPLDTDPRSRIVP